MLEIASYLRDRQQKIVIDNATSNPETVKWVVPQGSVLDAPSFTFYTAPLSDMIEAHGIQYMMYADDTQLYLLLSPTELPSITRRLEHCVLNVKSWAVKNKLKFNDDKSGDDHRRCTCSSC